MAGLLREETTRREIYQEAEIVSANPCHSSGKFESALYRKKNALLKQRDAMRKKFFCVDRFAPYGLLIATPPQLDCLQTLSWGASD